MNLENVFVILDHPSEERNIGSACRAMANCDIKNLRIVGKKDDYDKQLVYVLAIHASYIFDNAKFYDDINEATKDCVLSAGTTRRRGKKRGKLLLPEEFAFEADKITGNATEILKKDNSRGDRPQNDLQNGGKVAVVFGNERTGLTDEQLDMCTLGVTIPSSEEFGSLNLSHAVQIICYTLFRQNLKNEHSDFRGYTPISLERIDKGVLEITDNLQKVGFFKMPGRKDMEEFWRSFISRAALSEGEIKYLEKIFTKISGLFTKNQNKDI